MKKFYTFFVLTLFMFVHMNAYADDLQETVKSQADAAANVEKAASNVEEGSTAWKFPCNLGLNFGQTAFKNWAEGGENSITFNGLLNLNANYAKGKILWANNLYSEYGLIYSDAYEDYKFRKNLDKLTFTSKFGYKAVKSWYYSALVDFKTQFYKGYDYTTNDSGVVVRSKNSNFLAPAHLITSIGMDYVPSKYVSVFISPLTGRFTICEDTSLSVKCGLDEGERFLSELGAYTRVLNDFDIMKNVHLSSKLELFSAYETFGNVVVNWDVLLTLKVNKYVNASIRGQLKYDDAVPYVDPDDPDETEHGARVQLMDAIQVGFVYNF